MMRECSQALVLVGTQWWLSLQNISLTIVITCAIAASGIGRTAKPTLASEAGSSLSSSWLLQLPARVSLFVISLRPRKKVKQSKFITPSQDQKEKPGVMTKPVTLTGIVTC